MIVYLMFVERHLLAAATTVLLILVLHKADRSSCLSRARPPLSPFLEWRVTSFPTDSSSVHGYVSLNRVQEVNDMDIGWWMIVRL